MSDELETSADVDADADADGDVDEDAANNGDVCSQPECSRSFLGLSDDDNDSSLDVITFFSRLLVLKSSGAGSSSREVDAMGDIE